MIGKITILLMTIILSFQYKNEENNLKTNKLIIGLLVIILSFAYAFREHVFNQGIGSDYYAYQDWFNNISLSKAINLFRSEGLFSEIGFSLLMLLTKSLCSDYHFFLLVCGFLYLILVFAFIKNNSNSFSMSSIVFLNLIYFSSMNIVRQCLAGAVFLYAFKYIIDGKVKKYILLIVLASSFHASAAFLILLYPFIRSKISLNFKAAIVMSISCFIYLNNIRFINELMNISNKLGLDYASKYQNQLVSDLGNYTPFLITAIITIMLLILYNTHKMSESEKLLSSYTIIASGVALLNPLNIAFNRMSAYLFISIIVTLPITNKLFAKSKDKIAYELVILALTSITFLL